MSRPTHLRSCINVQDMREKLVRDDREGLEEMFRLSTKRREAFDKK